MNAAARLAWYSAVKVQKDEDFRRAGFDTTTVSSRSLIASDSIKFSS